MTVHNLNKIFNPTRIAVIGASAKQHSVGNTVLRNLIDGNFPGVIYPVNPKYSEVEGLPAFAKVADLPQRVDLAVVCTPASSVPQVVDQCGQANVGGLIILTAGFREVGEAGKRLEDELASVAANYADMRIIGPNCVGIIAPYASLNASFAAGMPNKGRVAFISQSGALCTAVLDWALQENVGFSSLVSVGNTLDADMGDLIDYFAQDPNTDSIILYVESIRNSRLFMSAARAFTRNKPIIAYKAGRFARSAQAAASHTGALAGVDSVYEAAFKRAGIIRVAEMSDLFDCAELLARTKRPTGRRLAIVTNAGGPGVMATDELLAQNGVLAELSDATKLQLNSILPSNWSHSNPIDVIGDATPERFASAMRAVLSDDNVDAAIGLFAPQAMCDPTDVANALLAVEKDFAKPILTCWMGGKLMQTAIKLFNKAGMPTYSAPEQAIRAFCYLDAYVQNRKLLYETPKEVEIEFELDTQERRELFKEIVQHGTEVLTESQSKKLLDAYQIPTSKVIEAASSAEAVTAANQLGYPVAMKILSPDITHKTDVGGVVLNITNADEVARHFESVTQSARTACPKASLAGVTIQRMHSHPSRWELIAGTKRDEAFGPVLLVGAGGTAAELLQDRALELPPLTERLARRMLESLRIWPLLNGYRRATRANIDRLVEVLIRLSYLVADFPEIKELDINPLLVTPDEVVALDARIVIDRQLVLRPPAPYSHLAIRPYPDEYVRTVKLEDNTEVLLRPIKPADEPLWLEMLASCSKETLWFRFQYLFKKATHNMGLRFCFNDYDREMAIVAEVKEDDQRKLLGVGRLVADADHTNAEYAVLVVDDRQGTGLGSLLTDYCLEICQSWNIKRIVAEVNPNNIRMLRMFEHRNFKLDKNTDQEIVFATRELSGDEQEKIPPRVSGYRNP
jgi:acetyltransferase